jgi:hypothetical protein
MNELALFAGSGGGILGGHLLGWRTIAAVEIEDYPRRVLLQRQADGLLPRFPIWDDICTFDGHPWRGKVDVISGGFPCQDISAAGKGDGLDGERSGLWTHMARVVSEVRPPFVFVENSPMLTTRGGTRVIADLTQMGYDTKMDCYGSCRHWSTTPARQNVDCLFLSHPQHHRDGSATAEKPYAKGWSFGQPQFIRRQGRACRYAGMAKKGHKPVSSTAVLTWPTPRTAGMCGGSGSWDLLNKNTTVEEARLMGAGNGGQLNPPWVEWLMGWPIGWTDLKPLGTDKFPSALPPLGDS